MSYLVTLFTRNIYNINANITFSMNVTVLTYIYTLDNLNIIRIRHYLFSVNVLTETLNYFNIIKMI